MEAAALLEKFGGDYATADILSGGRITFGVGRGYHTRQVETFGSPLLDQNANRELFEEAGVLLARDEAGAGVVAAARRDAGRHDGGTVRT